MVIMERQFLGESTTIVAIESAQHRHQFGSSPIIKVRKFLHLGTFSPLSFLWYDSVNPLLVVAMIHDRCPQWLISISRLTSLVTLSVTGYTTANTVIQLQTETTSDVILVMPGLQFQQGLNFYDKPCISTSDLSDIYIVTSALFLESVVLSS